VILLLLHIFIRVPDYDSNFMPLVSMRYFVSCKLKGLARAKESNKIPFPFRLSIS
jgi:hypothetical protein